MNIKINTKIKKAVDDLISSTFVDDSSNPANIDAVRTMSFGKDEVVVKSYENYKIYLKAMTEIYNWVSNKEKNISFKFFEESICKLLIENSENLIEDLMNSFSKISVNDYFFIRPMFGLAMDNVNQIKKGKYTFIKKQYIKEYLKTHCLNVNIINQCFKYDEGRNLCYVEIKCLAKDYDKAEEIANIEYIQLDNVLRFMIGDNDRNMGIGVFEYRATLFGGLFCKCSDGKIRMSETKISTPPYKIKLDDVKFFDIKNGNNKIWDMLNSDSYNEIEIRILKSIEWIGMAINEDQPSIAFIKCMFAIECLLQDQEGFITKSISAQIGEYVAFIVGFGKEQRIETDKLFKELYSKRSKIAHGTIISSLSEELKTVILLTKQIISNLLMSPEFQTVHNMKDLKCVIEEMRYSY